MIPMGITSTCDEYRRDASASAPVYPPPHIRLNAQ